MHKGWWSTLSYRPSQSTSMTCPGGAPGRSFLRSRPRAEKGRWSKGRGQEATVNVLFFLGVWCTNASPPHTQQGPTQQRVFSRGLHAWPSVQAPHGPAAVATAAASSNPASRPPRASEVKVKVETTNGKGRTVQSPGAHPPRRCLCDVCEADVLYGV